MDNFAWGDYAKAILAGGLPAALDLGSKAGTKQQDNGVERTPPTAGVTSRDTATQAMPTKVNPLQLLDGRTILIGVAGAIVVIGVLVVTFKSLGGK